MPNLPLSDGIAPHAATFYSNAAGILAAAYTRKPLPLELEHNTILPHASFRREKSALRSAQPVERNFNAGAIFEPRSDYFAESHRSQN